MRLIGPTRTMSSMLPAIVIAVVEETEGQCALCCRDRYSIVLILEASGLADGEVTTFHALGRSISDGSMLMESMDLRL